MTSERTRTIASIGAAAVAVVVIVVGLTSGESTTSTPDERLAALSESIKCPFCSGESLAESPSGVAADYRALIAERIEAGYTDEEILEEFAANFGDAYILDTSTSRWSLALWLLPILALAGGGAVIYGMRRSASQRDKETVGAAHD